MESFVLVDSEGNLRGCDRRENTELFRLAIGGYGLFGITSSVRLRLAPRRKLERVVEVFNVEDVIPAFEKRIADGFPFGDFQYATDPRSDNFLRKGVFSCYRPIDERMSIPNTQKGLSVEDLKEMTTLAHMDPGQAFAKYAAHYVATSGQIYWSDTHQLSLYIDDYHVWLDNPPLPCLPSLCLNQVIDQFGPLNPGLDLDLTLLGIKIQDPVHCRHVHQDGIGPKLLSSHCVSFPRNT